VVEFPFKRTGVGDSVYYYVRIVGGIFRRSVIRRHIHIFGHLHDIAPIFFFSIFFVNTLINTAAFSNQIPRHGPKTRFSWLIREIAPRRIRVRFAFVVFASVGNDIPCLIFLAFYGIDVFRRERKRCLAIGNDGHHSRSRSRFLYMCLFLVHSLKWCNFGWGIGDALILFYFDRRRRKFYDQLRRVSSFLVFFRCKWTQGKRIVEGKKDRG